MKRAQEKLVRVIVGMALVLVLGVGASWSVPASAQPTPAPTPVPCDTPDPDLPNDIVAAFAYELKPPMLLAFLTAIKSGSPVDERSAYDAAVAAASSASTRAVEDAEAKFCVNLDEIYSQTRALTYVANLWPVDHSDADRFNAFSRSLADALAALSIGARLAPEASAAALKPFARLIDGAGQTAVTAPPVPSLTLGRCVLPDSPAKPLHWAEFEYPDDAHPKKGSVFIEVRLSDTGDVRGVRYASDTLSGTGNTIFIRSAVVQAAAATYSPAISACRGVPGTFVVAVDFSDKP